MNVTTRALAHSATLLLAICVTVACSTEADSSGDLRQRQDEVAQRGAEVMPFDLEATTHLFEKKPGGVVQRVVADDPEDATQIQLVREHLNKEAARFAAGDFSDPTAIHGTDMPGVAELSASAAQISVEYAKISGGAQLTFTTTSPSLVRALHSWADAQVSDHGSHASHE